jgi:O-antigen/teichoic acid export membrane protein
METVSSAEVLGARASTARAGVVFTATAILQRGLPVLLLPLFVAHVPVEDYGMLAIAWGLAGVVAPVASLGLEAAVFRGFFTVPEHDRNSFILSNALFVGATSVAVAAALSAAAALLGSVVDVSVPFAFFALALTAAALYVAGTTVPLGVLRAERRLAAFAAVNLAYVFSFIALMLLLVVAGDEGAQGWLLSQIGAAGVAAVTAAATLWRRRARPALALVTGALALGLPLVPHALAHWVLALSDRLLLGLWVSAGEIGRYNIAYQLAAGIGLIYIAVNHSVMGEYGRVLAGHVSQARLSRLVRKQVAFVLTLGIAGATVGFVAVGALLPSGYGEAQLFLPWLVLANVLFGLYLIPMNAIVLLAGETRRIWKATVVAAVANIGLNLVLIPRVGAAGAVATTILAYGLLLVLVTVYARRRGPAWTPQPVGRVALALTAAIAASAVGLLTLPSNLVAASGAAVAWLVVGGAAVLLALRMRDPLVEATFPSRA